MNAMWDLWAKSERKPLWKLLVDLEPDRIVGCIDWRNLEDALTREEAVAILMERRRATTQRENDLSNKGPKAYCTAGWSGLSHEEILSNVRALKEKSFSAFKLKVGRDVERDTERIRFLRDAIGPECDLMVDANQYWGLEEAERHMARYHDFGLKWVEEPIAPR